MKRKTNTLDAEYRRRGLIRPTAYSKTVADKRRSHVGPVSPIYARGFGAEVVEFDWKGTTVWGVKA